MLKANSELREYLRAKQIALWEVAEKIGVHENSVIRWMRTELEGHRLERVMSAIEKIMTEKRG